MGLTSSRIFETVSAVRRKRGDIRSDGKVFWAYAKTSKNGEFWVCPEKFQEKIEKLKDWDRNNRQKRAEISMRHRMRNPKDNRPPPHLRVWARGDVGPTGLRFWGYNPSYRKGERWISDKEYHRRIKNINDRVRKRFWSCAQFRLAKRISNRIQMALKGGHKKSRSTDLLGCSIEDLKMHLEKLFRDGMSWENMGEWEIDHIRPCASFDLTREQEQFKCFHYTNLQPLWALENRIKSDKYYE